MAALSLHLLGPFTATLDDQPLDNLKTSKVQALLIYLGVESDRSHSRESLMEFLWPDMLRESAQVNLRQTVYRLRQAIPVVQSIDGDSLVPLIIADRKTIGLHPKADIQVDVLAFRDALQENPTQAVKSYRGDFLTDFYLVDNNPFEDWALGIRENLRRETLNALDDLTETCLRDQRFAVAQDYAWGQLEIDPLRESAYRQLMTALAASGQRNAAISLYLLCQQRLEKELGLAPCSETTRLFEQIQADALQLAKKPNLKPKPAPENIPVFLLTDVEGSTRLWDTHRQAMLPALLQHNQILEECITGHDGRILELRGDGVKAVFEGVNPLQCVLNIQKSLGETNWGEIGDLRIRIGLHGVPPVRKGFDYFEEDDKYYGPVLNHTHRIMDAGHGGQILVSEQVHQKFPLPPGALWEDFGLHNVKSLDHPVQIYGLLHPDLPLQTFPPLRTGTVQKESESVSLDPDDLISKTPQVAEIRNNLPTQPNPFIGREEELTRLDQMLGDPSIHLITIVGPGGMGKTRLALACVERQLVQRDGSETHPYNDGVFFVQLADIEDPDQILKETAASLRFELIPGREMGGRTEEVDPKRQLLDYLGTKRLLLVLDNFEQLSAGSVLLADLLQAAPGLKLLVTSRERLNLREEQVFPISGLTFPTGEITGDSSDYTAIQLFQERAGRVRPDFGLDPDDLGHVTRICRLVDGMPLGLELAASWIDLLSTKEIAEELQKSIDFLETDLVDLPERHRSLVAVCNSSWEYLSNQERDHFARLSVFRGGFTRAATRQVTATSLRILGTLVKKSLLQFDDKAERYRFHLYLRQFAAEKLAENPDDEYKFRDAHSTYFCAELETHNETFEAGQIHIAIERIEIEYANFQAAWNWAIKQLTLERIDRCLDGLCHFYEGILYHSEGLTTCQLLSEKLAKADSITRKQNFRENGLLERVHSKVISWEGNFNYFYDSDNARNLFAKSLSKLKNLEKAGYDVRREKAQLLFFKARIEAKSLQNADLQKSKTLLKESLSLSQQTKFYWLAFECLARLSNFSSYLGSNLEAKEWAEQGYALAKEHQNQYWEVDFLNILGWVARAQCDYDTAVIYFEHAFSVALSTQIQYLVVENLIAIGELLLFLGKLDESVGKFIQVRAYYDEKFLHHWVSISLGVALWLTGDFNNAEKKLLTSLEIPPNISFETIIHSHVCHIELLALTGRYSQATEKIGRKTEWSKKIEVESWPYFLSRLSRILGWLALIGGHYPVAIQHLETSINCLASNNEWTAWSQPYLALAHIRLGDRDQARKLLTEALSTAIDIEAYIPMVFSLPITLLLLAEEDVDFTEKVYKKIRRDRFMSNAQLFHDLVYKHLPEEITAPPVETGAHSDEHREALWKTTRLVLAYFDPQLEEV
jgi:predicted ATPase/DNA-binding SARP family transcriptional activator